MEDARKHKINVILVYKLDRFSRSLKELVNTIDVLKGYGVNFVSYTEKDFDTTTATGQLMFHIVSAFAQFERDMISERTKLKLRHLKSKGIKLGRPQKAGYEAIFDLRAKGLSLSQIGQEIGCDRSTVSKVLKKGGSALLQQVWSSRGAMDFWDSKKSSKVLERLNIDDHRHKARGIS